MEHFDIKTRKGECHGVYIPEKDTIYVHHINGNRCMKGLMTQLINKYHTNHIIFTPLITEWIEKKVRGQIKIISKDDPENPYREDIKIMDTRWEQ